MKPLRTAARGMLGATFVSGGISAVANPDKLAPAASRVTRRVTGPLEKKYPKLPTDPQTMVRVNGAVQLAGGLLLASGRGRRTAALALAASLVPTTFAGHPFWRYQDEAKRRQQRVHFMKNVGVLGGLLIAAADNEGRPGLRWRAERRMHHTQRSMHRMSRQVSRGVAKRSAQRAVKSGWAAATRGWANFGW